MATRLNNRPYRKLGELLRAWREEKFKSALSLFKTAKFSFSYYSYADFERGVSLPSVEVLLEVVDFLGKDQRQAVAVWAECQMPNDELKRLFSALIPRRDEESPPASKVERNIVSSLKPSFENTWVFGPEDHRILKKAPWLWELCLSLSMFYPEEIKFSQLDLPAGITGKALLGRHLRPWLEAGKIIQTKDGLKLHYEHLHLPQTDDWNEIRKGNLHRAMSQLLEAISPRSIAEKHACRDLIHRPFSHTQVEKWTKRFGQIIEEMLADPYPKSDAPTYAFTLLFGPRTLLVKKPKS